MSTVERLRELLGRRDAAFAKCFDHPPGESHPEVMRVIEEYVVAAQAVREAATGALPALLDVAEAALRCAPDGHSFRCWRPRGPIGGPAEVCGTCPGCQFQEALARLDRES